MSSTNDQASEALAAIGGDEMVKRLRAKGVESCDGGILFYVPLLGGLVQVRVTKAAKCWDVNLLVDALTTMPRTIESVPTEKLGLILGGLFNVID
jgi:hypothetical protein